MDYKRLLKKYIEHIGYIEGISFISANNKNLLLFTEEEWAELERLNEEQEPEVISSE